MIERKKKLKEKNRRRRRHRKNAAATLLNKNKRAWIRITNLDKQISGAFVSTFIPAKMSNLREFFLYQKGQYTFVPR